MAGWNVAASNRSARFILGKTVTADISSTFRKQIPGKGVCFVNYGNYIVNTVALGDVLSGIGQRFGVNYMQIAQ